MEINVSDNFKAARRASATNDSAFYFTVKKPENPLHFSSLTMSETKFVKFIFRQSHPFYSV